MPVFVKSCFNTPNGSPIRLKCFGHRLQIIILFISALLCYLLLFNYYPSTLSINSTLRKSKFSIKSLPSSTFVTNLQNADLAFISVADLLQSATYVPWFFKFQYDQTLLSENFKIGLPVEKNSLHSTSKHYKTCKISDFNQPQSSWINFSPFQFFWPASHPQRSPDDSLPSTSLLNPKYYNLENNQVHFHPEVTFTKNSNPFFDKNVYSEENSPFDITFDFEPTCRDQDPLLNPEFSEIPLTIFVKSSSNQKGYARRKIIRNTYGKNLKVVFLMLNPGGSTEISVENSENLASETQDPKATSDSTSSSSRALADQIHSEVETFRDILLFSGYPDSFSTIAYKYIAAILFQTKCNNQDYVLLTDDDVYIFSDTLVSLLSKLSLEEINVNIGPKTLDNACEFYDFSENTEKTLQKNHPSSSYFGFKHSNLIVGNRNHNALPKRKNSYLLDYEKKYVVSEQAYPFKYFPDYVSGAGILFTFKTIRLLADQVKTVPVSNIAHLDDVYIGILAHFNNLKYFKKYLKSIGQEDQMDNLELYQEFRLKRPQHFIHIIQDPGFNGDYNLIESLGYKLKSKYGSFKNEFYNLHLGNNFNLRTFSFTKIV